MSCKTRIIRRCNNDGCRVTMIHSTDKYVERVVVTSSDSRVIDSWIEHHVKHAAEEGCDVIRRYGTLARKKTKVLPKPEPMVLPDSETSET